jgi:hypothetical protein
MWDLKTIVQINDETQRRADAIREYEARERQADDQRTCQVNGEDEQAA